MEKMTFPASNNKAPYRGVASTEGRIHGFSGGGGGGGGINSTRNFFVRKLNLKKSQISSIIREITHINRETRRYPINLENTDINLKTGRYGSKSGDSLIIRER